MGLVDSGNPGAVRRCHQIMQTVWVFGLVAAYLFISNTYGDQPEKHIVAGHFVLGAVMTPLLMFAICWMAFHTDKRVRMGRGTAVALIASVLVILVCVLVNLYERYEKLSNESSQTAPAAARVEATARDEP
jgi:hypothetical protein